MRTISISTVALAVIIMTLLQALPNQVFGQAPLEPATGTPTAVTPATVTPATATLGTVPTAPTTDVPTGEMTDRSTDADAASTQPVDIGEPLEAVAIKVVGHVLYAMAGPDGKPGEFKPVHEGDKLCAGAIIQTRLRSKVMLSFGPDTVVLIDRVTMAGIDQFHRTGDTKKVQLGLGHGLIRAAAVDTTLRSDMTISNPIATLSKRGTLDFGMRYEPGTGRYVVFLNQDGLVELLDFLADVRRSVHPGQYVTQALLTWIETRTLDRYIPITDVWGITQTEAQWNAYFGSQGVGVVEPGAGSNNFLWNQRASNQPGRGGQAFSTPIILLPTRPGAGGPVGPVGPLQFNRPEGNFGTGRGR